MRVLVVEDYPLLAKSLTQGLREAGYAVDATGDGEEALWYARESAYDVIVLDLMLPQKSGLEVLAELRAESNPAQVLILTACGDVPDRVRGLDAGADDYMTKPFALEELLARVRVLCRRRHEEGSTVIRIGDLELDSNSRRVTRCGTRIDLSQREYALIEYLARRTGTVVARDELWEHVYDFAAEQRSNVLEVHIANLRRKIDRPFARSLLHTRRGLGYLLADLSGGEP